MIFFLLTFVHTGLGSPLYIHGAVQLGAQWESRARMVRVTM